ncbi:hypothetical protein HPB49_013095 [Dermacentor silvarum]|uniref:Uncharacterized protein n=1 Tax=Dermacentor silvarum TaxID=543639 RepID=A0ACB8CXJ9_DERSI|nr:hypothetical protein HPB49_013095 [Dermacentor silvarum]
MGTRSPDVKYVELRGRSSSPAVLQQGEQMSRGEPPPKGGAPLGESARLASKSTALLRIIFRTHSPLRSRCVIRKSGRRSVYTIALGCINKLASWIHALWLARKTADDGRDVSDYYNALCSDEEWSTSVTAAELSLCDSDIFKDGPL